MEHSCGVWARYSFSLVENFFLIILLCNLLVKFYWNSFRFFTLLKWPACTLVPFGISLSGKNNCFLPLRFLCQDSALFVSGFPDANKYKVFFLSCFLLKVYFHQSPKIKVIKKPKIEETKVIDGGSGSVQIMTDPEPGGPKTYGSRSTTLNYLMGHLVIAFYF